MPEPKFKLGLSNLSIPDQLAFANRIAAGIRASTLANKEALALQIETAAAPLQTRQNDLDLALRAIPGLTDERNLQLPPFQTALAGVLDEVVKAANGNVQTVTAIGFQLASDNRTPATMTKVLNLQLSSGDEPGEIHAHWDPIKGAKSYVPAWFSGLEPSANEADWRTALPFSKSRGDLKGLPSNMKAWVKIRAIGSGDENIGPWSDPISVSVP